MFFLYNFLAKYSRGLYTFCGNLCLEGKMSISSRTRSAVKYLKTFLKWLFCAGAVGLICGAVGVSFHYMVDIATKLRAARSWLLYLLPAAGLFIVFLYRVLKMEDDGGTKPYFSGHTHR